MSEDPTQQAYDRVADAYTETFGDELARKPLVALYSIIHVPPADLPAVSAEFFRVLRPGSQALISFHLGDEVRHLDEWFDRIVSLDFHFHPKEAVVQALTTSGFLIDAYIERPPYEHEAQTTRAYLLARRPELPNTSAG